MQAKCVICDTIDQLNIDSPEAKRMRKHKATLYLCPSCDKQIETRTKKRHKTGKFKLFKDQSQEDPWFGL